MQNKLWIKPLVGLVGFFVAFLLVFSVFQMKVEAATNMSFSVSAVLPDNQVDKSKTYFDLQMRPGENQIIEVELANASDRELTVETHANTAITNDNGIVDYSYTGKKMDPTLKVPFSKVAKVTTDTTIPKKGTRRVKIALSMPEQPFSGVILGGLHFKEKEPPRSKTKEEKGVQIENKYAFVIGVVLRESEEKVKPTFKLGKIQPSQINFRNVLKAEVRNPVPVIISDMEIQAHVTKRAKKKVLFETNREHMRMAPNSHFDYGISWENQAFQPGKYTLHMTLKAKGKTWKWTKDFEIDRKEAKKYNDRAVELEKDYTMYYIIGGAVLVLVLLILVYWLGRRSHKKAN